MKTWSTALAQPNIWEVAVYQIGHVAARLEMHNYLSASVSHSTEIDKSCDVSVAVTVAIACVQVVIDRCWPTVGDVSHSWLATKSYTRSLRLNLVTHM